jgi:Uma2 family endonuclease
MACLWAYHAGMTRVDSITTAAQLLRAPDLGRCELVRGKLIMMTPAGFRHGRVAASLTAALTHFVAEHRLGVVTSAETGFHIEREPDTVRAPDVAYLGADRVPAEEPVGFFPGAPDLAVEVLSPDDRASEVNAKVQKWLEAGCRAVWVVDPQSRTVTVYCSPKDIEVLRPSDVLTGGSVLPGFTLPVDQIFSA